MAPADALPRHWTARLPGWALPYAQLSRLDRPVGWRLLLLPCLMGVAVARAGEAFVAADGRLALAFFVGAVAMRGAGCTYNDILDRDIDAKVARTRGRPLPSGRVRLRNAWLWLLAQCAVGLAVLLSLPPVAQIVALGAIPLVALYPLMKRLTWWPQAWLGLTFSYGALVAGAAIEGRLTLDILALYAGCVAWTIAYDTLYALQDIEDDALIGVKSTARLFGPRWRAYTAGFYGVAFLCWAVAAPAAVAAFFAPMALIVLIGLSRVRTETALGAFKNNVWLGLAVAAALAAQPFAQTVFGR